MMPLVCLCGGCGDFDACAVICGGDEYAQIVRVIKVWGPGMYSCRV